MYSWMPSKEGKHRPDLSDIHLPKLKGIGFIRTLQDPPMRSSLHCNPDYALMVTDLEVMDYL
jgi:hypothetical protein